MDSNGESLVFKMIHKLADIVLMRNISEKCIMQQGYGINSTNYATGRQRVNTNKGLLRQIHVVNNAGSECFGKVAI